MGLFDSQSQRVAYAPPNPRKIFQKIMDWLEETVPEGPNIGDEEEEDEEEEDDDEAAMSQLAEDFMFGWETANDFDRKELGLMAANGQCDPKCKDVRTISLLRGVELWDMMISCAKSLKEKQADPLSLDGQDLLTQLGKLIASTSQQPSGLAKATCSAQQENEVVRGRQEEPKRFPPPPENMAENHNAKKRKRVNASHFFDKDLQDGNADGPSKRAKIDAKKAKKKMNRRSKRAHLRRLIDGQSTSVQPLPAPDVPVLRQASDWYRDGANREACKVAKGLPVDTSDLDQHLEDRSGKDLKGRRS
jgi:hypothetical protein